MKISTVILFCAFALCCLSTLPSAAAEAKPESVFIVKDGEWVLQSGGETMGTSGSSSGMFWYSVDPEKDEAAKGLQQGILLYNGTKYSFLPTSEEQRWVENVFFSPNAERMVLACRLNRFSSGLFVYDTATLELEKEFWAHSDLWFVDDVRFAFTLVERKVERPQQAGMWGTSAALYDPAHDAGYVVLKGASKTENFTVTGADENEIEIIVTTVKSAKDWEEIEKQEDSEIKVEVPAALPADHAQFLQNGEYQEVFGEYAKIMAGLKTSLSPDEYAALEEKSGQEMENSARQGMKEYGFSELEAWRGAYAKQIDELNNTLVVWETLKSNPAGIQGYYRLQGGASGGYLTVQAIEGGDYYAVRVSVGDSLFFGSGQLKDGKITAKHEYDADYDDVFELFFDGNTARVKELRGSNKGALDGTYLRERK